MAKEEGFPVKDETWGQMPGLQKPGEALSGRSATPMVGEVLQNGVSAVAIKQLRQQASQQPISASGKSIDLYIPDTPSGKGVEEAIHAQTIIKLAERDQADNSGKKE